MEARSLPIRVLLIEDDADDCVFIRSLLSSAPSASYAVDWASTFQDALQLLDCTRHDICLLDYRLGEHDGIELLQEMSNRGCVLPTILLTGQGSYDVDVKAMQCGAVDYLLKSEINEYLLERSIRYAIERKRGEEKLKASEEKMRVIIESSPIGVRICSQSRYVYVNPVFLSMFGYDDIEEIRGMPEEMLFAIEGRQIGQRGQPPVSYEAKGIRKNGEHFDIAVRTTRTSYQGEPAILDFVIDVSSEKALQARLIRAQKTQALGTLASGIAHDFNNILGIILGLTELARCDAPSGSTLHGNLTHAIEAVHRGIELVNQILTFSRPNEQPYKPLHLSSIVKEALKLLRASLPATIEIRQRIDLLQDEDVILSDPTQVHQILINLCTNAAQAMGEKGGVLDVELSTVRFEQADGGRPPELAQGDYVRLSVRDTGHGIEPGIVERIFDPYFTTKGFGEGTGLGLGVVSGIVRSHGGAITVLSERGVGTTFHIYLPRWIGELRQENEEPTLLPGGTECILIVDDEPRLVEAAAQILNRLGYTVVSKTSAVDALETFRDDPSRIDLVITDQTMPQKTGLSLAREILRVRPGVPIILCTGFSEVVTSERARAVGIRELILKPFVMSDIAATVRRVLDENRSDESSKDEDRRSE